MSKASTFARQSEHLRLTGRYEKATELGELAVELAKPTSLADEVLSNAAAASAFRRRGQLRRSLRYVEKVNRRFSEVLHHPSSDFAKALLGAGQTYRRLGDISSAARYFDAAYLMSAEVSDDDSKGVSLNNIGLTYQTVGLPLPALEAAQTAADILRSNGNSSRLALTTLNIAMSCMNLAKYNKAEEKFENSNRYFSEARNFSMQRIVQVHQFEMYRRQGFWDRANRVIEKSVRDPFDIPTVSLIYSAAERLGTPGVVSNEKMAMRSLYRYAKTWLNDGGNLSIPEKIFLKLPKARRPKTIGQFLANLATQRKMMLERRQVWK